MSQNIALNINYDTPDEIRITIDNHSQKVVLMLSDTNVSVAPIHKEACENENNNKNIDNNKRSPSQGTLTKVLKGIFQPENLLDEIKS